MTAIPTKLVSFLVSRERNLRNSLNYLFSVVLKHHFETVEGSSDALKRLAQKSTVDVVFVHLEEPCSQWFELIKVVKSARPEPVVIALHSGDPELSVKAFFAGADDAIKWPCNLHELATRLFVRLGYPLDQKSLMAGDISWEAEAYIADRAGLTTSEAQVMRVLYNNDGEIVSRDELSLAVDERHWRYGDRKFDVHVAKMRKKLSDSFGAKVSVSTTRTLGYCLVTESSNIFDPP